jgi:uncharacterized metal-binding protein YceD (DUF177 family)
LRSLEFGEIRIPIAQIRQGICDFKIKAAHPELQIGMPGDETHEADVSVHVVPVDDDYLVELSVENEGVFVCDRCGEPLRKTIKGHVKTLFVNAKTGGWKEESEEVRLLSLEAQFIDILQDAVDALLLAVPIKILCRDSCKGLCLHCGKNLNNGLCSCSEEPSDSRWDALKNITFDG